MKLEIINDGDIFECSADALVFPASNSPKIYGTLDGQVYKKAGEKELLETRKSIGNTGGLENGKADITDSFDLKEKYKYLIHTAVPEYKSGHSYRKLKNCYISSLRCAEKKPDFCSVSRSRSRCFKVFV